VRFSGASSAERYLIVYGFQLGHQAYINERRLKLVAVKLAFRPLWNCGHGFTDLQVIKHL
jgi:hypothetical protein